MKQPRQAAEPERPRAPQLDIITLEARQAVAKDAPATAPASAAALDTLSRLLSGRPTPQDTFKLDLFGGSEATNGLLSQATPTRRASPPSTSQATPIIQAFARGPNHELVQIMSSFQLEETACVTAADDGDGLLALMDMAG